jgi:hypothetical protein
MRKQSSRVFLPITILLFVFFASFVVVMTSRLDADGGVQKRGGE